VVIAEKRNLADPFPMANPAYFNDPVRPGDFNAKFTIDHEKQRFRQRPIRNQDRPYRHFPFSHECCQWRSILITQTMRQFRESTLEIDCFHSPTPLYFLALENHQDNFQRVHHPLVKRK